MKKQLLLLSLLLWASTTFSQNTVLTMRQRAEVEDKLLDIRFQKVIPELMRREGIDMWVLICREYNEDPVVKTMLPATWLSARRRTILVFHDKGVEQGVERVAIARYDVGRFFKGAWIPEREPDQFKRLAREIIDRNPKKIALNYSNDYGHADGITHTEFELFKNALPSKFQDKIVSGERLSVGWLETRTSEEIMIYRQICRIAHEIIEEGLSEKVIHVGITTSKDVEWWYRERIAELKLETWFHPSVTVQRTEGAPQRDSNFSTRPDEVTILAGDLVHVDFGITYLGLNTDTQQHLYVLKPNEKDAPEGLKNALKIANRLQDHLTNNFKSGKTGNEILKNALTQSKAEGINGTIYTHPIGMHGHAAGPTIGMWDNQGDTKGAGDYPMYPNTAYSIELNAAVEVPEWNGKVVRIMLEEDGFFDGEKFWYIDGRQTKFWLLPRIEPTNTQKINE
ncbi:MAG: aminopeptidase P family protein [Thermoflexibacter sp.]|jgi:Xaa-Pro aminopeptidase|nr:aminopeptidase P family protein [Thermoflexibacter sp.]